MLLIRMIKVFFLEIAPWVAYAFFVIAPIVQTWRLYKRKTSHDISLSYFILSIAAQTLLVPRLINITNDSLLLTGHLVTLGTNLIVLVAAIYYRQIKK